MITDLDVRKESMVCIVARVLTGKLRIRRSMAQLFLAFCCSHLSSKQHEALSTI